MTTTISNTQLDKAQKLYILTYRTLPIGYQAVQCAHALREFTEKFAAENQKWYTTSNTIVLLTCSNLQELNKTLTKAQALGISYAPFYEPDIDNELTAIAFVPCAETAHLLRHFQLLGR